MNPLESSSLSYGEFRDARTLVIQRRLPGSMERVWSYLTDSELRGQWLATGILEPRVGSSFELVWRNDRLSHSPQERPEGFPEESRAICQLTELDPPRKLRFSWPGVGDVTMTLEPAGDDVLLTLVHRDCAERSMKVMVSAGWHAHLGILAARLNSATPPSFWPTWQDLKSQYEQRIPA